VGLTSNSSWRWALRTGIVGGDDFILSKLLWASDSASELLGLNDLVSM
jgi:hypothetical protein